MTEPAVYGVSRDRPASVVYADIERAALTILATDHRPSVETVRKLLGRGSPATIAGFLKRFWRDLGVRAQGDPAALTRLPAEIIEAVEALWQRSLTLAAQSAKSDQSEAHARLERIRIENEVRSQSFELRERAYETAARERERALADSRDHLLSTLRMLDADRLTLRLRDKRIAELEAQLAELRARLESFMARAVGRNRRLMQRAPPAVRSRPPAPRRPTAKKRRAVTRSKRPRRK
jgi:hypothetical protein